ncbi:uncharacterized protein LOC142775887 [Rhipicephalus microplus]|uniref:uncharacterized protein LOC142775887 n=1 Tax=Rhipicephalus microplus TaxID=6941 RepID=UPI003F6B3585
MQALRVFILAAIAAAVLAAPSSPKTKKSEKTPQLQRRLGLARIELPQPKLKGLAHRLLQVKRGFLSAQVTANDGHLVGLSFRMKHGHKPGYHLKVGQEPSKGDWDGPGYNKKSWGAFDSSNLPYGSYSSGPYSSFGSQNYQSMFRDAHGLSLGHESSLYSEGLQSYNYKDAASFGHPFSGYQVPGYVTTVPKIPVIKLVDSGPTMLPAVSGVYDQATVVQTPTLVQSFPAAKAIGGHAKVPAARIVHKVPLSAFPKKITDAQQQVPGTAYGFHPVVVQKVPVSKLAVHVPQSHYVMHTVKPVTVIRTPIYAATGAGELYPIDVGGSGYQDEEAGGAQDGAGNGNAAGAQGGESQEGQSNGHGGGAYGNGGASQRGQFNGGGGGGKNYGGGHGGAGASSSRGFNGAGGGIYGHGNGASGGFSNGGFNGGSGGNGGNYGQGNSAEGGFDSGGFNGGGRGKYGQGNGAGGGFNNGEFNGGGGGGGSSHSGGYYGQGNGAAGGFDSGEFNGGGGGKYGYGNGASGSFSNGGYNGGGGSGANGRNYGHGNGAAGGSESDEFNGGGAGKYGNGNGGGGGFYHGEFNGGSGGGGGGSGEDYGQGNGAAAGFGNGAVQKGHSSSGGGSKYGGGSIFAQGLGNNGAGSQEGYGNRVPSGGRGYENGGGTHGFPPGLAHHRGDNGEGQVRNTYGSAGTGTQPGYANGGYQGGNDFSSGAGSVYTNGGLQSPQQHAFPQAVTEFKDVQLLTPLPGGIIQKHGYNEPQNVELVYGGVQEGSLQTQIEQYPDIPNPEESIARGQIDKNTQGVSSPRGSGNRRNGNGWKPIIDPRYNAKFKSGSIRVGEFGSRLQRAPQGDRVLKNAYGGVHTNSRSSYNGATDGLVNGDLQVKGSHVQYPKYRYTNQGSFEKSRFQENGGGGKSEGSGESYFSPRVNENGNGAGNSYFSSDGNSEFLANGRTKQYNGGEGNGRLKYFRNGGGIGTEQNGFEQSEVSLRNGGSGAPSSEISQRGSFQGNDNGRNFGQTLPSEWLRGTKNGGGPTPPKFCPKGGWRPIIIKGKKGNGLRRPNGFEVPVQEQNGDDVMRGRYNRGFNGLQGNGEVRQRQDLRENGGDSGSYFRAAMGQFGDVGTSGMQAEIVNRNVNAALGNGQSYKYTGQGSLGLLSEPSIGGHRGVGHSSGQGFGATKAFEAPRQFLKGRPQGVAFSGGSTFYEGEELPGEESFKREEIKKVYFRPPDRQVIKVPKSVIFSGHVASLNRSNKLETPIRVLINIDTSISPSQMVTTEKQPSLAQLLATYKSDGQERFPVDLRSLRGHGYRDVSFSETVKAPIQKFSPVDVGQPEIVKTVSEGLLAKEVKTESLSDLKKVVVPESVEAKAPTEESSEEADENKDSSPAPEPIGSADSSLSAKKLLISDASIGAPAALVEPLRTKPDSSSSEEVVESEEKDPPPKTSGGGLEKSALHNTRGGFETYYGQRRRPIGYKQDRISSSYVIPVRVPTSLKSKVRMSRRS